MTTIYSTSTSLERLDADGAFDEAQLAAASFLARYSGRTLDAYRHDLRVFFQWSADVGLTVLAATRPHIELYRGWMEDRGLAASTIDRRLPTVCGYYRFAHIDGRIPSNPAQYVRRPKVQASEGHHGSPRTWHLLVHCRALRSLPRRACRAPRAERPARVGGVRDQRRGPWLPTRTPHVAHPRQGQQASADPSGAAGCPYDRPRRG